MSLNKIVQSKLDRLDSVPADFTNVVAEAQKEQLRGILKLLNGLDIEDGIIRATDTNFQLVQEISNRIGSVIFQTDYASAIVEFANEFDNQAILNQSYFTEILGSKITDKTLYQNMVTTSKVDAVNLLNSQALQLNLSPNIKNILLSSVSNEIAYGELVSALNLEILGSPQRDGSLLRYSKQIARDFFNVGDARYTNIVAEDLSMDWFQYSAGRVKDSRDFCLVREGNFYHKSEIEMWPYPVGNFESNPVPRGHQWQGRHPDTNSGTIWVYRGGYKCMHSFLPVLTSQVPEDVRERVQDDGDSNRLSLASELIT